MSTKLYRTLRIKPYRTLSTKPKMCPLAQNKTKSFEPNISHKVNVRSSVYKIKTSMMAKCIKRGENSPSHITLMAMSLKMMQIESVTAYML